MQLNGARWFSFTSKRKFSIAILCLLSVLAWSVYATLTSETDVKFTPLSLTVISDNSLPPEVKALESQTAPNLFDRDTNVEYTAYADNRVDVGLERDREIHRIKLFGPAPYTMSLQAQQSGTWQDVPGLQNIDLTMLAFQWHSFDLTTPVTTKNLRFVLTPKAVSGVSASGLREIEIWGQGQRSYFTDVTQFLKTMLGLNPPEHGRIYTATPAEGVIAAITGDSPDDTSDNTFTITLPRSASNYKRAWLSYDVYGIGHWVAAVRTINNNPVQGGLVLPRNDAWSTQTEAVDPAWLNQGPNNITFLVPAGMNFAYTVKNVRLVVELEDGSNMVAAVKSNQVDPNNDVKRVRDGDTATGWNPYPTGNAVKVSTPTIEYYFDKPTQPSRIALYLDGKLKGTITVAHLNKGAWTNAAVPVVDAKKLLNGWNNLNASSTTAVDGVRLTFTGGNPGSTEVREVFALGSGVGPTYHPALTVSYPDNGQYFGRTAYLRGFLQAPDNGSGTATIYAGTQALTSKDGAFEFYVSKEDVGLTDQADETPWSVEIKAIYPDGTIVKKTVALNQYQTPPLSTDDQLLPTYAVSVAPGQAKKIRHDGAALDINKDAVDVETTISITPLRKRDLPALDTGMTNVTKGPRRGYRFLPHGMKFKKKIQVKIPYNKALIPAGHTEKDVKTYYFDEEAGSWKVLERVSVDSANGEIVSNTTHFTDMINAVVTVPDHPQATSFNPTQIKDIKAADPGAKVNLIGIPQANNMGDARLSYPIEIPPGRNGLQPQIALQYNSSGGNGWLGMGWSLPEQAVTIDTRWGVPRYDGTKETETYLLNGEQLTPVAHRGVLQARTAEKIFHTRVEGQFRKIIRHGSNPKNYWWEVIDKYGTRYFYGGGPKTNGPTLTSTLMDDQGNVYKWALREVRDTNQNSIKYTCVRVSDSGVGNGQGGVAGVDLYLKSINYTRENGQTGAYTVTFIRDRELSETRRSDVSIDARGGFKRVTADRLRKIDITFNGQRVRSYALQYKTGAFLKSLLKSVQQFDEDNKLFNTHTFNYFDEIRNNDGSYKGFNIAENWNTGDDNVTAGLLGKGQASALSGTESRSAGGHLYIGFNIKDPKKPGSFGLKIGHKRTRSTGVLALMDINSDGLPDKVFKSGSGFTYRPNQSGPSGGTTFGALRSLPTLSRISRERSRMTSFGGEQYLVGNAFINKSRTFTTTSAYFSDANGDGLPDLVSGGQVLFNRISGGTPTFNADSSGTPYPVGAGAVDATGLIEDFESIFQENINTFPLDDTLRRWVAPFNGTVRITGAVALIQDTGEERQQSTTVDGVRVAIQHNGGELWSTDIGAADYSNKTPTGVNSITVSKGDRLYFRVQSKFDGTFDQVSWDPQITYLSVPATTDVNGLNPYQYQASSDFTFAGRRDLQVTLPFKGTVRLEGDLQKTGSTTDDIILLVLKNGSTIFSRTLSASQTGSISLGNDFVVTALDTIELRVKVDSPIDLAKITWVPKLFYIAAEGVDVIQDDNGAYLIQLNPAYNIDMYPLNNLVAAQTAWTVTQTGTLTVVPTLTTHAGDTSTNGTVYFTIKKAGQRLSKHAITIVNGVVTIPSIQLPVTLGDKLYFDFSVHDPALRSKLNTASVIVAYGDPNVVPTIAVPSALHSAAPSGLFAQPYRGWAVAGYNGNRDRAAQPIKESELVLNQSYTLENAKAYPFAPVPTTGRWQGPDDLTWVQAGVVSSSRLGLDVIEVPRVSNFAGVRAPSRLSQGKETSIGAGASFASGSASKGTQQTLVDYIDMNGDRFPDIVGNGRIQYTAMTGGLDANNQTVAGFGKVRGNNNTGLSFGIGGNPVNMFKGKKVGQQMSPIGFSGNLGKGDSDAEFDLMDVNGDGLPDRVSQSGGSLSVALNLGYRFAPAENWGTATLNDGESKQFSIGGGGFNDGIYSYGGGLTLNKSENEGKKTLLDLNGDGLLDRVRLSGGNIVVGFNTGNGFAADVAWPRNLGEINLSGNTGLGGGVYFTIPIGPVCLVGCYIIINPGVDLSNNMGRQELSIRDIDGDGYPDHLKSDKDSSIKVARNLTGRTNLLKHVSRPLGATIDVEYQRSGNTFAQPQNRWVMNKVTVFDGLTNDHKGNGADYQVSIFKYENGFHNRLEREFYGFAKVTETQLDTTGLSASTLDQAKPYRKIIREFLNNSYYAKGLLARELAVDVQDRKFLETVNTYLLRDINTGNVVSDANSTTATVFPELARTDKRFFEGQSVAGKSTHTRHEYDPLGNVKRYFDAGDSGAADDVDATIGYHSDLTNYIVGKANSIVVMGAGRLMRKREATIAPTTGNLLEIRQFLANGQAAVTNLSYFANGNLQKVIGPANHRGERYSLDYVYDAVVSTHVTRISDSFGYVSTATYNFKYGQVATSTDQNGKQISNVYDKVGRISSITGPYQTGSGQATISFEYHPEATVPHAITRHNDRFRSATDTIDTYLFTDGLKRVLQTKKDGTVHVSDAGNVKDVVIVSGRVSFDHVGRTIEQHYPVTETRGSANTVFNTTYDGVRPTVMSYDVLDRNLKTTIPDNTSTTIAYGFGKDRSNKTQFRTRVTDANGIQKHSFRDVRSLISAVKEFNVKGGQPVIWTSYVYDPLRQITRVVDDKNNTTKVSYDNFGRRTIIDNPDLGNTETKYDLASNVIGRITANLKAQGKQISYTYEFNRLINITYPNFPGNNVTYAYGAAALKGQPGHRVGRITKVTDESGAEERFYGPLGETTKTIKTINSDTQGASANSPEVYTTEYTFDTWNRMRTLTYPDGEVLTYEYDSGGLLKSAQGKKGPHAYAYINRLEYDKFSQRRFMALGNNVKTNYTYDPLDRRLLTLKTGQGAGTPFQNLEYTYDDVGNILKLDNKVAIPTPNQFGGPVTQTFAYDDLYRLTNASGAYQYSPNKSHQYSLNMAYSTIHNITTKQQTHDIVQPSGQAIKQRKTSYNWLYGYGSKPHAPTHIGNRTFAYDGNGNQTGWTHDQNGTRRNIVWDEENRIQSIFDNGHEKTYKYNDAGQRVIKRGPQGETVYVNQYFTIRNREVGTKHIFAGTSRTVSKLMKQDKPGANPKGATPLEKDRYFYHPDHLGSSSYVTDSNGKLYQHLQYFPFGETWVEQASNTFRTPYLFTAKELDPETGLYYYGARYYDPRTSVWQSGDPILGKYLNGDVNNGVFNPRNLGLYAYTYQNPILFSDPDGMATYYEQVKAAGRGYAVGIINATALIVSFGTAFEGGGEHFLNMGSGLYNDPQEAQSFQAAHDIAVFVPIVILLKRAPATSRSGVTTKTTSSAGKGLETRGVRPKPGERTIQGQVEAAHKAAGGNPTIVRGRRDIVRLRTKGHGFGNQASGTPRNVRRVNPRTGKVHFGKGRDRPVTRRDIKELHKARTNQGTSRIRTKNRKVD